MVLHPFDGTEDGVETIIVLSKLLDMYQAKDVLSDLTVHHLNTTMQRKVYDYTKFEGRALFVLLQNKIDYLEELVNKYPIITIEDGMTKRLGWKAY